MTRRGRQRNRGGAEMDPARYSPITSQNRRRSFAYAVAGCAYMLRYQKNARVMLAATLIVMAFAFWLGVEAGHWAILILAVGLVWLAEFINAAIEAAVNLTASEFHPMAKAAKDVAAAAVLIAVFAAVMIGLLILGTAAGQFAGSERHFKLNRQRPHKSLEVYTCAKIELG